MPSILLKLRERARACPRRIVFAETDDPRVMEAVAFLQQEKLVIPILADDPIGSTPSDCTVIRRDDRAILEQCTAAYFQSRRHRGMTFLEAETEIRADRLLFAALLVRLGFADGAVNGSIATTQSVLRAGIRGIGVDPQQKLVSSFFLMELTDDRLLTYADCGVVPNPNAEELAQIAITTALSHRRLLGEVPKVAMLSFSTKGSAEHADVQKVRDATQLAQSARPDLIIDGELQFDAAMIPSVAARKAPDSPLKGSANVLIFPDLDAGNLAYKITERLAGATALGPLIQGLRRPFMDLSRGCKTSDIVDVAVIASCSVEETTSLG